MGGINECASILTAYLFLLVILSERGPRRTLQLGGGESKDLLLFFVALYHGTDLSVPQ